MTRSVILVLALATAACSGTFGAPSRGTQRALTAGYVASTALLACDVGGTIWMSHGGRYDREAGKGFRMVETNPLLGHEPDPTLLFGIGVALATVGVVVLESERLPTWAKAAWFAGVGVAETYAVAQNVPLVGACGLTGTGETGFVKRGVR